MTSISWAFMMPSGNTLFDRNGGISQHMYRLYAKQYTATFENPPFFPTSIEELAQDACFATRVALISQVTRIRVDVRMRIINRDRYLFKWLLLLAHSLCDEEFTQIRVFVDKKEDCDRCNIIWDEMVDENNKLHTKSKRKQERNKVGISLTSDINLDVSDKLIIIYNPDNVYQDSPNLLDEVQALCFHGALREIPIILINPNLVATAWNDFGAQSPLLLSDFSQVYYACDDYFMLNRKDQWCGIVQRAASGFDLFVLEGLFPGHIKPDTYTRVQSWSDGLPDDIHGTLSRLILADPKFSFAQREEVNREWAGEMTIEIKGSQSQSQSQSHSSQTNQKKNNELPRSSLFKTDDSIPL
eukprot:gene7607-15584_t